MPHFVIEYSRDVENTHDIAQVMQVTFDSGMESGVMSAADIKVRAMPFDHHLMQSRNASFLHVTVFLLKGRSDDQKAQVSLILRKNLVSILTTVTSVSVDIRDMNTAAYKKRVLS